MFIILQIELHVYLYTPHILCSNYQKKHAVSLPKIVCMLGLTFRTICICIELSQVFCFFVSYIKYNVIYHFHKNMLL